jgi:hypothetical protein
VTVFLVLLWAVHAPIVSVPVIRPALLLGAAATVLLLPLTAEAAGPEFVVAAVAVVCAVAIVTTMASGTRRRPWLPARARRASPGS